MEDHCRAIDLILTRGRVGEVYNIGGRSECENIALVRELCGVIDQKFAATPALRARFRKFTAGARRALRKSHLLRYRSPGP